MALINLLRKEVHNHETTEIATAAQNCHVCKNLKKLYRVRLKDVHILLSNSQAGPARTVKQEQEDIFHNHVPSF